jgi:hypothetical protein
MKISNLVEQIFSQAVALNQSGGLRNTIYAIENEIYIMNYDHTVLLRFRLRKSESPFSHPVSFKADDYDSNEFEEKDGKIIFHSENENYIRKKTCGTSDLTPEQIRELYLTYIRKENEQESVQISKNVLELLEDGLSHIEFSGEVGNTIKMIQRNIYSGGIIEIQEKNKGGFFHQTLKQSFDPVAMKTGDFQALFTFENNLSFSFPINENEDYILVKSVDENRRSMRGVIACCLYDEIIQIRESKQTKIMRRK